MQCRVSSWPHPGRFSSSKLRDDVTKYNDELFNGKLLPHQSVALFVLSKGLGLSLRFRDCIHREIRHPKYENVPAVWRDS